MVIVRSGVQHVQQAPIDASGLTFGRTLRRSMLSMSVVETLSVTATRGASVSRRRAAETSTPPALSVIARPSRRRSNPTAAGCVWDDEWEN